MSDDGSTHSTTRDEITIAMIIERTQPMVSLDELVIDDLTDEDEERFFGVLEEREHHIDG